jgi:hypothetical protein
MFSSLFKSKTAAIPSGTATVVKPGGWFRPSNVNLKAQNIVRQYPSAKVSNIKSKNAVKEQANANLIKKSEQANANLIQKAELIKSQLKNNSWTLNTIKNELRKLMKGSGMFWSSPLSLNNASKKFLKGKNVKLSPQNQALYNRFYKNLPNWKKEVLARQGIRFK